MSGFCLHTVHYIWPRNQTYSVACAPTVTSSVFVQRFRLFLGQCIGFFKEVQVCSGSKTVLGFTIVVIFFFFFRIEKVLERLEI